MTLQSDLLGAIEVHSAEDIQRLLRAGISAVEPINGRTPIEELTSGYLRSDRFVSCLRVLIAAGATIEDDGVRAVFLDDRTALEQLIARGERKWVHHIVSMRAAFTSCESVTLLHLCAEFNSVNCAQVLLKAGADVDARAAIQPDGLGGQTPIFHAVNNIYNYSRPMLELLIDHGASLDVRVAGLVWGAGMDWETVIVDATPLSYAQCGLYKQFQRPERDVYSNLSYLYQRRFGRALVLRNVPNKYLA